MAGVSLSYLGVAICADAEIVESDEAGARIATREPMPVGTELELTTDGAAKRARVTAIAEVGETGMRVAFVEDTVGVKPKRRRKKTS